MDIPKDAIRLNPDGSRPKVKTRRIKGLSGLGKGVVAGAGLAPFAVMAYKARKSKGEGNAKFKKHIDEAKKAADGTYAGVGAGVGALGGTAVGGAVGGLTGASYGYGAGALAGSALGRRIDRKPKGKLEKRLSAILDEVIDFGSMSPKRLERVLKSKLKRGGVRYDSVKRDPIFPQDEMSRAVKAATKDPSIASTVTKRDYKIDESMDRWSDKESRKQHLQKAYPKIKWRTDRDFAALEPGLIEFGKGIKIRRGPVRITKNADYGEYRVAPTKAHMKSAGMREEAAYYTDDKQDARNTAAYMIRNSRKADRSRFDKWHDKALSKQRFGSTVVSFPKEKNLEAFTPRMIEFGSMSTKRIDRVLRSRLKKLGAGPEHFDKEDWYYRISDARRDPAVKKATIKWESKGKSSSKRHIDRLSNLSAILDTVDFTDPRPRNQQGMFADVSEAGANPDTMRKAYGSKSGINPDVLKKLRRRLPRFAIEGM